MEQRPPHSTFNPYLPLTCTGYLIFLCYATKIWGFWLQTLATLNTVGETIELHDSIMLIGQCIFIDFVIMYEDTFLKGKFLKR